MFFYVFYVTLGALEQWTDLQSWQNFDPIDAVCTHTHTHTQTEEEADDVTRLAGLHWDREGMSSRERGNIMWPSPAESVIIGPLSE